MHDILCSEMTVYMTVCDLYRERQDRIERFYCNRKKIGQRKKKLQL